MEQSPTKDRCEIICGDALGELRKLPGESVQCCVTSPPFWGLRDYGTEGQLGLEKTPEEYVSKMVEIFREVRRVLRKDGTLWLNLASSYAGSWGNYGGENRGAGSQRDIIAGSKAHQKSYDGLEKWRPPSSYVARRGARTCGSDGKERPNSPRIDSVCFDLCDECRVALSSRTSCSSQQQQLAASVSFHKVCKDAPSDRDSMIPGVDLLDALASTKPQSLPQSQAACSHCANCDACLNVLASATRDASLCVRKASCNSDTSRIGSESSNQDKHVSDLAYSTIAFPQFKAKDMVPIPWMVAMALQADGWYLRSDIIWAKPNPMPESVTDRPTKSHEYLFLLTKSPRYFYDAEAIKERQTESSRERARYGWAGITDDGSNGARTGSSFKRMAESGEPIATIPADGNRNKRSVWTVATAPFSDWTETVHWERVREDVSGGGIRRIVSPDSPTDGGLFDLLSTVLCDERGENSFRRIFGKCNCLSLLPRDGFVPFEKLRAYYFGDERLDSFLLSYFDAATRHNIETNKTALFVSTSLSCKPSAERANRIGRILTQRGWPEQDRDMLLSNTWPDDWPAHLWEQTLYRIGGTSSCGERYRKTSDMTSHFACYPPDLIKPCILAGTSAKGCCAKCGAPWERVVKASGGTIGWQPTCKCEPIIKRNTESEIISGHYRLDRHHTEPCTILDPFAGSGTTGQVALELGRKAILIELNPKYVELIEQRCNTTLGLAL